MLISHGLFDDGKFVDNPLFYFPFV
jgi:hypothetical protein